MGPEFMGLRRAAKSCTLLGSSKLEPASPLRLKRQCLISSVVARSSMGGTCSPWLRLHSVCSQMPP